MHPIIKNLAILATVGTFATVSASAIAGKTITVKLGNNTEYGSYLVDGADRSLYLFEADQPGKSTCYDECAQEWPPLTITGEVEAGDGIDAGKLATIERKSGKQQVTYDGHPLYLYKKDEQPGQTKGQDIMDSGAEWYLLKASGTKVGHEEEHKD